MTEQTLAPFPVSDRLSDVDAEPVDAASPSSAPRESRLYQVVWRWHFYAGLLFAPVIWVLALTGAIYTFRTELVAWRDRELQVVTPRGERLSYDRLFALALEQSGAHEIEAIRAFPEADRSVQFVAHPEGEDGAEAEHRHQTIYVDPYTGKMLGAEIEEEDFFAWILDLHRTLLMGSTGRVISELATGWSVILIATGVYLWWPRGKKNVGVWAPRLRGKTYAVLRDWHAVTGAYLAPLIALVAFTGLFFSLAFGTAFNSSVKAAGHWPMKWFGSPVSATPAAGTAPATLDVVATKFLTYAEPGDVAMIRLAAKPEAGHSMFLMRDADKNSLRMVTLDQYTAEPIDVIASHEVPFLYRVRLWAVSIHMGQIFGTPTKILALLASLALFGLSVTGVWMWWRRRPRGRTGFPRRPEPGVLPAWGWLIVAVTGVILPVAGASMLLAAGVDALWGRRTRRKAAGPAEV